MLWVNACVAFKEIINSNYFSPKDKTNVSTKQAAQYNPQDCGSLWPASHLWGMLTDFIFCTGLPFIFFLKSWNLLIYAFFPLISPEVRANLSLAGSAEVHEAIQPKDAGTNEGSLGSWAQSTDASPMQILPALCWMLGFHKHRELAVSLTQGYHVQILRVPQP